MKKINVLVAEDNPFDYESTYRKLMYMDSIGEIIHVEDGEEAINYLNKKGEYNTSTNGIKPDLILLDIMMPKMTGLEVLEKLKENSSGELNQIPVIMLTSLGSDEINKKCFALGASGFLNKPVHLKYLEEFFVRLGLQN